MVLQRTAPRLVDSPQRLAGSRGRTGQPIWSRLSGRARGPERGSRSCLVHECVHVPSD